MFSNTDIISKAWLVTEVVNLVLTKDKLSVDKIFLIGSYANGNPTTRSDIDYLVQLKGGNRIGMIYPTWNQINEIHGKLGRRIHVVFGTAEAQASLQRKSNNTQYRFKEIVQGRIQTISMGAH